MVEDEVCDDERDDASDDESDDERGDERDDESGDKGDDECAAAAAALLGLKNPPVHTREYFDLVAFLFLLDSFRGK